MARRKKTDMEKYNSPFAQNLRSLMRSRGLTQDELANVIGKTRQTVSQYINGVSEPNYGTLSQIANYFRVSIDFLLGISHVESTDCTIQQIAKITGLAEKNIQLMIAWNALEDIQQKDECARSIYEKEALLFAESYVSALQKTACSNPHYNAKIIYVNLLNNVIRAINDFPSGQACELYDLYINAELKNYYESLGAAEPIASELRQEIRDEGYYILEPKDAAEWYLSVFSGRIADAIRENMSQAAKRYVERETKEEPGGNGHD